MAYYALVLMGIAYDFIGDVEKSDECFKNAELFCIERNEHLLNWVLTMEKNGRYDEMTAVLDKMEDPLRVNPFPNRTFLIENRAYHNTGNFIKELRERVNRRATEHVVDMKSIKFDFK